MLPGRQDYQLIMFDAQISLTRNIASWPNLRLHGSIYMIY